MKKEKLTFEESMEKLEQVVSKLENGDLPLEEAVNTFKEGLELSKNLNNMLDEAEKSITVLLDKENGTYEESTFEAD